MQESGLRADQVSQVPGFADQRLRNAKAPEDASNRRISIIVQYVVKDVGAEDESGAGTKEESGEGKTGTDSHTKSDTKAAAKK